MIRLVVRTVVVFLFLVFASSISLADPCGMVPPIYNGQGPPITRVGLQKTYVFYKDGVETFVIRPGFSGKVDEFGMLIPFPTVPAIRKTPDDLFDHIANAIDPPEVVIDLRPTPDLFAESSGDDSFGVGSGLGVLEPEEIQVIKREAVGMYEVAVLAAGSAESLKRWMDEHGFRYPNGMDKVTADYIEQRWCFVAVKTQVGEKEGVEPKPSQRKVSPTMKQGASFDGFVQGMGFRFKSEELVVPMRLSAFNGDDFHNVVYVLTDGPRKIRNIPEEYVVRQVNGEQLYRNLTEPLPLRIVGGTEKDLKLYRGHNLTERRDPKPKNGLARLLFAADLMAIRSSSLTLAHEKDEKQLLQIGEHFGLRGKEIDAENSGLLKDKAERSTAEALDDLESMTLTVVDGDFPREVLSKQNLTFAEYSMPARLNRRIQDDTTQLVPLNRANSFVKSMFNQTEIPTSMQDQATDSPFRISFFVTSLLGLAVSMLLFWKRSKTKKF